MLIEFGKMLHSIQDLYAHTNYVRLFAGNSKLGEAPIWNMFDKQGNPNLPKDLVNFDYVQYNDEVYHSNWLLHEMRPPPGSHAGESFDSASHYSGGQKNAKGVLYYELALDLATRHTAAAWKELERQLSAKRKECFETYVAPLGRIQAMLVPGGRGGIVPSVK